VTSAQYKEIAERAKWFFGGHQARVIREWKQEMERLSANMEFEEAAKIRDRIDTLTHMRENVTFRQATETMVAERVKDSRGVQELMQGLGLPRPPQRIECVDISHIQGVEKVASMVSFAGGRPDKSNYRKFIIRTVEGIDDFESMAEVVGRRYRRLKNDGKPFPDLVLIDGGKGQLSFAMKAINALQIQGLFVAALAKQEEEIFLPGRSESIRLPMDSPALLLLRYVRDEAHRFAITFHRLRRGKRFMNDGEPV
jgi:excinuclease ABC subunit C